MTLAFLLIGISWDQFSSMVGEEKKDEMISKVKEALAKGEEQFKEAGYDYEFLEYGPDESMDRLTKVLESRTWSGVCIGNGIRSTKQFTTLFEALVNTIHEKSPQSRLLFNTLQDDTMVAVRRWFTE
ncbi:hypothetical protein BCR39DRAFT_392164 [Naematelia encephala]|uniref:Uncharacterized protein n=1 Tax=Naematelia encephala TaxID=71784 RepID=A0A1Y2AHP6_9TREE|nr:hypothetical protein BCR39DRAFT_392164 [Naematelia encephala]